MGEIAMTKESNVNNEELSSGEYIRLPKTGKVEDLSDGYHTFKELYELKKVYNAVLFNEWGKQRICNVHKSKRHFDGELCFGGGWFIVVAMLPCGQITNHYPMEDWDLFKIPEYETALYEYDGHTPSDVLIRLRMLD